MSTNANWVSSESSVGASPAPPDLRHQDPPFRPQRQVDIEGTLLTAQAGGRAGEEMIRYCQEPLCDLVRQAILWPAPDPAGETWTGTFRFLIVEFADPSGPLYVQLWSEPFSPVLIEVGPGEREDPALQAIASRIAGPLTGRGFAIGGSARNYRKRFPAPLADEPALVAAEMLAVVTDVLGFDGTVDLQYRFCQSSHLRLDRVVQRLTPEVLQRILLEWDIRAGAPANVADELEASAHGFDVRFYFFDECRDHAGEFEEVHAMCIVRMDENRAREIVTKVNTVRYAFRAWPISADAGQRAGVCFTLPLPLAGGVTLRAIRSRLDDWFRCLQALCAR